MKEVYLVRHGESEANARTQQIYKGKNSPLTERGLEQAERIAKRVSKLSFDVLIASPWERAKQTAEAIARQTGKEIEFSELFTETRGPSSLIGMPVGEEVGRRLQEWNATLFSNESRYEDGENFSDALSRAQAALAWLEARPESHIVVATHGLFLRLLMAAVLIGETLTPAQFRHFLSASKTDNTGITVLQYGPMQHHETDSSERWRVRVFNDHAHLA
jgi:broad specificity phosphatase PhoE